jgi:hypothetical protein
MVKGTDYNDVAPIAVNGATTVRSKTFDCRYLDNVGMFLQLAGTSPNISITIEFGPQPPANANLNAADPQYVPGDGIPPVVTNMTSTTAIVRTLVLVPMKHFRLVITGNAGNSANTTVDFRIFAQELVA